MRGPTGDAAAGLHLPYYPRRLIDNIEETHMRRRWTRTLTALSAAFAPLVAQAQGPGDRAGFWHYGSDWGWGHMIFGSLMMLLFWGAIIVLIVVVVRWLAGGPAQGGGDAPVSNRALDILQERYARGEIDREEYEQKRRDLNATGP